MFSNAVYVRKRSVYHGLLFLTVLSTVATLASYYFTHISPQVFWPGAFLSLGLPMLLGFNLLLILLWLMVRPSLAVWPLGLLIAGAPFISATVSIRPAELPPVTDSSRTFNVLSYNVSTFISGRHYLKYIGKENALPMVEWVTNSKADILCLQEFYNNDSSSIYNTVERLISSGRPYYYMTPIKNYQDEGGFHSVAIFSRYPIVRGGDVIVGKQSDLNRGLFADIKVANDTVRVYSLHLESMTINEASLFSANSSEKWLQSVQTALGKIRRGTRVRGEQIDLLKEHIANSPYPAIVCGDFNDLPYSYTYFRLKKQMLSAFEEAGNGFGFTYNGKLFFLRLDNQFYDPVFQIHHFETLRSVPYSEHFPIEGTYSLPAG
ncbi:Metal-dependent hydrolase, endonuclease/exonuclease/phosphatase family [Catalinimonas alkaloidigena]|uniref:Metal-dependent hydrolase, endonuclease/exonuclease/phosphatase family n=2 Tax=Catalinimonas alkaloidigena TaxID=1075417 RepID=A0A1G9F0M7_9BACT|nr:Metal-dependent hydrolase, endonuclease/exonuclease/phosphatase family [Catalinimonas alkaloidigena]